MEKRAQDDVTVRALEPGDAEALVVLRREALASHPLAFASSPGDDRGSVEFVRSTLADPASSAVYGAFLAGRLSGMAGVYRPEKVKMRHRAEGWGMSVAPAARGRGAGAALLGAVVEHARAWPGVVQVQLSVSEAAPEAARLYERAGFREWGREPRALCWDGRFVDERHLVLDL